LVELEGEAADIDAQFVDLEALIRDSGSYNTRIAQNAAERMAMWKGRKSAFSAVGRLSPDFIVEHGVGLEKRDFLAEQYGEADIACMKRLQQMMDPGDIANPGKVFAPLPA